MNTDTVENNVSQEIPEIPPGVPGSVVHHITYLMTKLGVEDAEDWYNGINNVALTSADVDIQRFHINRLWNKAFTSLPADKILETRNARGCLMHGPTCSLEDYSRLFETEVIPCAIRLGILTTKTD